MICALFFLLACDGGPTLDDDPAIDPAAALVGASALRNCLKVAGGLKKSGDAEVASQQVLSCYHKHFGPMEVVVRERNRRAALSLEYGFGHLAWQMTQKGGDVGQQAGQLADRVEAVLGSLDASEAAAEK